VNNRTINIKNNLKQQSNNAAIKLKTKILFKKLKQIMKKNYKKVANRILRLT